MKRGGIAALAAVCALLGGCGDYTISKTTTPDANSVLKLPPVGFNHVYGQSPIASQDAMTIERQLFANRSYWEIYLATQPVQREFVKVGDIGEARAARHAVTSLTLVLATEDRSTINGLLAYPGAPGAKLYAEQLLQAVRTLGYDNLSNAQLSLYFSEAFEYASLTWSKAAGYSFTVYLKGWVPARNAIPLPQPSLE